MDLYSDRARNFKDCPAGGVEGRGHSKNARASFTLRNGNERVSIVLPFYRAAKYISEAVESVFAQQGYTDWRLYLVNDGSDEGDVEIARRLRRRYPDKIELLEHPGRSRCGISASRNLGIRRADGDLIAFLDADDVWYPHKLRSQVAILDAHPSADMIYGPALRWFSWSAGEDVEVPTTVDGFGSDCLVPGAALLATFLRDEALTPCTGSVLIRRSAIEECGYFEDRFWGLYDDQVLYSKLCLNGEIFVSSDCVSRYRKHSQSCCSQALAEGTEVDARERFLGWLRAYERSSVHASP